MTTRNLTNINTSNLKRVVLIGIAINVMAGLSLGASGLWHTSTTGDGLHASTQAVASPQPSAPIAMTYQEPFGAVDTNDVGQGNKL
jgi:hypothetical protein